MTGREVYHTYPTSASDNVLARHKAILKRKWLVGLTFGLMFYVGYTAPSALTTIRDKIMQDHDTGYCQFVMFFALYTLMLWSYTMVVFTPPGFAADYVKKSPLPFLSMSPVQPRTAASPELTSKHAGEIPFMHDQVRRRLGAASTLYDAKFKRLKLVRVRARVAILNPFQRYCSIDGIVRPHRTHHCQSCNTCILKYSHHCDWIGQCLGVQNYKYFVNFCLSTSLLSLYGFTTYTRYMWQISARDAMPPSDGPSESGTQIQLLGLLSALFLVFTGHLLRQHVKSILHGHTLIERMHYLQIKDKEEAMLSREFGCWEVRSKRQVRKYWDQKWGSLETEGNIWWRGSRWAEWVGVMGINPLGWIFPIKGNQADGLDYATNPRFDQNSILHVRSEWPEHLR